MTSRSLVRRAAGGACILLGLGCSEEGGAGERPGEAAALASGTAPARTAEASEVTTRGVSGSYSLGDYLVLGEVVNGLDVPIHDVEVAFSFQDAAGRVLATDQGAAMLSRIEPGSAAPVMDTHFGAPEGIARVVMTVSAFSRESRLDHRPLTITGVTARTGVTGVIVTGQARNDAGRPLSSGKLVAWFRNPAGEVSGVFFDYPVIGGWQPGRTVDFTIETIDATIAGHEVTVRGEASAGP